MGHASCMVVARTCNGLQSLLFLCFGGLCALWWRRHRAHDVPLLLLGGLLRHCLLNGVVAVLPLALQRRECGREVFRRQCVRCVFTALCLPELLHLDVGEVVGQQSADSGVRCSRLLGGRVCDAGGARWRIRVVAVAGHTLLLGGHADARLASGAPCSQAAGCSTCVVNHVVASNSRIVCEFISVFFRLHFSLSNLHSIASRNCEPVAAFSISRSCPHRHWHHRNRHLVW